MCVYLLCSRCEHNASIDVSAIDYKSKTVEHSLLDILSNHL